MTHTLVDSLGEAVENIRRCQTEIQKDPQVAERMRHVRAWYAVKSDDGMSWLFGPSRFVGGLYRKVPRRPVSRCVGG